MNHFRQLPLEQLRVIRGNSLYDRGFALSVFLNYPKQGSNGLQHLGLTHLTEILEGGVQIVHNRFLRYGPWVNWDDIVRDRDRAKAPIDIQLNGERGQCLSIRIGQEVRAMTQVIDCSLCYRTASATGTPSLGPKGSLTASTPKP
uniref:Receptor L-domain domain-containing protein n=1 Tax=Hucho hucho TaxID=62062 RepID=A0A4W5KXH3_9TELE